MKFYKLVAGKKFYCNEKGEFIQKDGANVEVPETDTEAVDVEAGTEEVTKMIQAAIAHAKAEGDKQAEKQLQEALKNVNDFIEAVGETAKSKAQSVRVSVKQPASTLDVVALQKEFAPIAEKRKAHTAIFQIKSEADLEVLAKSNNSRADIDNDDGDAILPDNDPSIDREPVRSIFMEQIANVVPTESDTLQWTEVVTETGAPATTAELAEIPKKKYQFQVFRSVVEKIAVINKHSVELLKHGPSLVAAIKEMLREDLMIETDDQLLQGNGTSPQLQGVLGVAEELDATAIGTKRVANANLFDVLRVAHTKILIAGKGKFLPNFIVLNPDDSEELDLTKDAEGRYILPPFYSASGMQVKGARVIENTGIAAGTFLIGDFRKMNVRPKGGVEVEITNSDGDDFEHDLMALKLRRFLGAYVKTNHSGAFMTGDIAACKAALVATGS